MALETIDGNLLDYKGLEPGTFQHSDQLTTARRTDSELRSRAFYTADGNLYTLGRNQNLWAVTRLPQNLILSNIDAAYRQLTGQGNYFPALRKAKQALSHEDTVIIEQEGLELEQYSEEYGYFVIDPGNVLALNSQRRIAAQRIYGPDEENFGLNMEMFAIARKHPCIFALMPGYVRRVLKEYDQKFLMRASWLVSFYFNSNFGANNREVNYHCALRGERKKSSSNLISAPESGSSSDSVCHVDCQKSLTMEEILATS